MTDTTSIKEFFTNEEWHAIYDAMSEYQDHGDYESDILEMLRFTHTPDSNMNTGYYNIVHRVRNETTNEIIPVTISYDRPSASKKSGGAIIYKKTKRNHIKNNKNNKTKKHLKHKN